MADLSELFARLKSPNAQSPAAESPQGQQPTHYHQPSVSSPIDSPHPTGPRPHHPSAIMSPVPTPGADGGNADRSASLLNLLRFTQPQQQQQGSARSASMASDARPQASSVHSGQSPHLSPAPRPVPTADSVPSFKKKPSSSVSMHFPAVTSGASGRAEPQQTASTENPQDLLLKLLNQPKSAASDAGSNRQLDTSRSPSSASKPRATLPAFAKQASEGRTQSEAGSTVPVLSAGNVTPAAAPIFTYANPFDQLARSSPLNRPSRHDVQRSSLPKPDTLKYGQDISPTFDGIQGLRQLPSAQAPRNVEQTETSHETVSQAVDEVGQQLEKELEHVLGELDVNKDEVKAPGPPRDSQVETNNSEAKHELEDEINREILAQAADKPIAKALTQAVKDAVADDVADSWESADAEDSPGQAEDGVKVFNFPMKPFVTISVVALQENPPVFRPSTMMEVAKLKKEFDQMDRQLVSASKNFIVYATLKPLGFRIIRQETGQWRQVFSGSKERIFNISMCNPGPASAATESETVLGTGVNGSIFWTTVFSTEAAAFDEEDLDGAGFIFPPAPVHDDNTSGGQLKTRAKTSMRHPEFFAVGRGKSIHLVYPKVARTPRYTHEKTRICDSEKYLKERTLKIVTGKAGKDFAFSADDSVIVSLDKAGKMRFWDIRPLWEAADDVPAGPFDPVNIRTPIWTLQTTSPSEKSWPTSVFFLDKERPLTKGIAVRYMIVGQKQNHTLQLWDLGLGKAVQELSLPHNNESDAICTLAYHAKSGILVIGHPTRNSIYFVHISAPKYSLSTMSQAKYLTLLADPKSTANKPESTAIMSGIREYSLGSKGTLRTLHLLEEHASNPDALGAGDAPVFELYVVHSKGVSLISIHREDLGWTKDYRVANAVDAAKTGAVTVSSLRVPAAPSTTEGSVNGDQRTALSTQGTSREIKKESASTSRAVSQTAEAAIRASTLAKVESKQEAERAAVINGSDKVEKKKKKRAGDTASQLSAAPSRVLSTQAQPSPSVLPSYAQAAQRPGSPPQQSSSGPSTSKSSESEVPNWALRLLGQSQQPVAPGVMDETAIKRLSSNLASDVGKALTDNFGSLYKRIDDDKRAMDATGAARQEGVLRLVSSTLGDNVDQAFSRHIKETITSTVLPALNTSISSIVGQQMANTLHRTTNEIVTREFASALPGLIDKAMQEPDTLRIISDLVASKVNKAIESQVSASFQKLTPVLQNMAATAAQQASTTVDHRVAEQFRQAEMQRQADATKIDQLTRMVQGLTEGIKSLTSSHGKLQAEIARLQRPASEASQPDTASRERAKSESIKEDPELEEIRALITEGRYEEGTIMWLQSQRQAELFDILFVRCSPAFIQHLSQLVALSVAAAATSSLETYLAERLIWLEAVFATLEPQDPEIIEVLPQIMDVIAGRLQAVYMQVAEKGGESTTALKRISVLVHKTMELKNAAQSYFHEGSTGRG